jgi:beta-phosphoglucomutase-like phosphatase (HAD superfamily)
VIKLIIFDLDGVLVDSREIHYEALNMALLKFGPYQISREEHLSKYDGLSTTKKLKMLSEEKGLPEHLHTNVWKMKQEMTLRIIDTFTFDERMRSILRALRFEGYKMCVASNAIRETVKMMLLRKGLLEFFHSLEKNMEQILKKMPLFECHVFVLKQSGVYVKCPIRIIDEKLILFKVITF